MTDGLKLSYFGEEIIRLINAKATAYRQWATNLEEDIGKTKIEAPPVPIDIFGNRSLTRVEIMRDARAFADKLDIRAKHIVSAEEYRLETAEADALHAKVDVRQGCIAPSA